MCFQTKNEGILYDTMHTQKYGKIESLYAVSKSSGNAAVRLFCWLRSIV